MTSRPTTTIIADAKGRRHSIHGRVANLPARLAGYGERWDGDECTLWCEGVVSQATVFGENLQLTRRIEVKAGTNEIELHDSVVNRGFYRTPHMYMYHVNVGHPVVAEGSRYLAPITDVVWAAHAGPDYRKQKVPLSHHAGAAAEFPRAGLAARACRRHDTARRRSPSSTIALGIGFEVVSRKDQFPCMLEWQNMQAGLYVLGMEPSTHHVLGHEAARERGELIWLEHGEERRYDVTFRVLAGKRRYRRGGEAHRRHREAAGARIFPSRPTTTSRSPGQRQARAKARFDMAWAMASVSACRVFADELSARTATVCSARCRGRRVRIRSGPWRSRKMHVFTWEVVRC